MGGARARSLPKVIRHYPAAVFGECSGPSAAPDSFDPAKADMLMRQVVAERAGDDRPTLVTLIARGTTAQKAIPEVASDQ